MSIPFTSRTFILLFSTLSVAVISVCPRALASQTGPVSPASPSHSGRTTIAIDVAHLNSRLTANYGKLGGEYQALQSQTAGVQAAANADAKAQNGRLTPIQVATFTRQLSQIGRLVSDAQQLGAPKGDWMANHPSAAKILNSAESINKQLSQDFGSLGGHYVSLELQDDQIRAATQNLAHEQNDLSKAQITKFDTELANLQNEINQDLP